MNGNSLSYLNALAAMVHGVSDGIRLDLPESKLQTQKYNANARPSGVFDDGSSLDGRRSDRWRRSGTRYIIQEGPSDIDNLKRKSHGATARGRSIREARQAF